MFEEYDPHREKRQFDLTIRAAVKADITAIVNLSLDREAGDPERISASIKSYVDNNHDSIIQVAVVDSRIVGFGKARHFQGEGIEVPGWYLSGLIVAPEYRHANLGSSLTLDRLDELKQRCSEVYYFDNAINRVSIELHQKLGFKLIKEPFVFPKVTFTRSHGQLYLKKLI